MSLGNNISFARTTSPSGQPAFIVDRDMVLRDTGHQIAWEYLDERYQYGAVPITANGAAAAAATTITVDALLAAVPDGTIIRFGAGEFAQVTADAAAGATSLTVEALVNGIEDNDVGYIDADIQSVGRQVKAGTVMCELADGRIVPRVLAPGAETAKYLLATVANEDSPTDASTGYGIIESASVYENLLPESAGGPPKVINAGWKTELLAHGGYWIFKKWEDNT